MACRWLGVGDFPGCLADADVLCLVRDAEGDGDREADREADTEGAAEDVLTAGVVGVWVTGAGALPAPYM
jgi:hypothetical protein